ncbi:peptide-methionine (R)-S-oxide reductase MsrB [Alkalihalobacillus deserti]|uniref:peptide-methionine (R)-S-oxide reductase MsrB n=1 Tax=Alkalihalobacillus deserti TaxID=2879466 RepID=UPI001D152469|nr:peptide-methionine (R)-S-oxide reductase MsrB [Alkalihalobacillus deserti]
MNEVAMFAGGHFWFMVPPFIEVPGVEKVMTGYTGGYLQNPSFEEVTSGNTGHQLVIQINFDSAILPYKKLLEVYWRIIDPTDVNGQFKDRGEAFRSAIYYNSQSQKEQAEQSKYRLTKSGRWQMPIVTEILQAPNFYPAEEKHQNYYRKLPFHYLHVFKQSGRAEFIKRFWQIDKEDMKLLNKLTAIQYEVTQKNKTEQPFENEYYDQKLDGIYVDLVTGEPLFSSTEQYDAGCGWPSFTKPIQPYQIKESLDHSYGMIRTEVRSLYGDSHLGHVFDDGLKVKGGRCYCINSAALRFIPKSNLKSEGYGEYLAVFKRK